MAGLGIYHYGARFYSPKLGRFLSADTIVPGYANPQNLNRFSYGLNNPSRYTDPTGHWVDEGCGCESNGRRTTSFVMVSGVRTRNTDGIPYVPPPPEPGGQPGINPETESSGSQPACGQPETYSPDCPGWHEYTTTNVVCPADLHCEEDEMKEYLLLFAYPGQRPVDGPVNDHGYYSVSWPIPYVNISMGSLGAIRVEFENGGFTTVNTTLSTHILYDGRVDRTLSQLPDGAWIVTTHGYGNNVTRNVDIALRSDLGSLTIPVNFAGLNGWGGPILPGGVQIFDNVDADMLNYIIENH